MVEIGDELLEALSIGCVDWRDFRAQQSNRATRIVAQGPHRLIGAPGVLGGERFPECFQRVLADDCRTQIPQKALAVCCAGKYGARIRPEAQYSDFALMSAEFHELTKSRGFPEFDVRVPITGSKPTTIRRKVQRRHVLRVPRKTKGLRSFYGKYTLEFRASARVEDNDVSFAQTGSQQAAIRRKSHGNRVS